MRVDQAAFMSRPTILVKIRIRCMRLTRYRSYRDILDPKASSKMRIFGLIEKGREDTRMRCIYLSYAHFRSDEGIEGHRRRVVSWNGKQAKVICSQNEG